MKVNLVGPLSFYGKRAWKQELFPLQNLSLPAIAALTPEEHEISFFDIKDSFNHDGSVKGDVIDADMVGVSVLTIFANQASAISEACRERGVYSVHGGIHASALPHESPADTVFVGEAEGQWEAFLEDFKRGEPKRFYVNNGKRPRTIKLKKPRTDLLTRSGLGLNYVAPIEYSRGCPHSCEYCCVPIFGKGYSMRPVEDIVNEIEGIEQKYLFFISNNLVGMPKQTKEMLMAIKDMEKKWIGAATPDSIVSDHELVELMSDSGCVGLFYGFESLSDEYIKSLNNPRKKIGTYEDCIKISKDYGIAPEGSFIFGSDYDDCSVFERVLEFIQRNKIPLLSLHILTPYPGTRLHAKMEEQNRLISKDFSEYDTEHVVFRPKHMTPEELHEGFHDFYKEAHSLTNSAKRLLDRHTLRNPWVILGNMGYTLTV